MIHFECEAVVACPSECADEKIACILGSRSVKTELEEGGAEHIRTRTKFGVELFLSIFEFCL